MDVFYQILLEAIKLALAGIAGGLTSDEDFQKMQQTLKLRLEAIRKIVHDT